MLIPTIPCLLLIVGDEINHLNDMFVALSTDSWRVVVGPEAIAGLYEKPSLVLCATAAAVAQVRGAGEVGSAVPILAFARDAAGADAFLDPAWPTDRLVETIAGWRPDGVAATLARLEAAFGRDEIHALLVRLRDALTTLGRAQPVEQAHRLAGLAGTLGFPALGGAWSALSEGKPIEQGALYRLTRVAITAIDARLERDGLAVDPARRPSCAEPFD